MDEDEPERLEEALELALTLTAIDAPTLHRLAAAFAHLSDRVQAQLDCARGALLPGQVEFERSLLDLEREMRVFARSLGVLLPAWPTSVGKCTASVRLMCSLGAVVRELTLLASHGSGSPKPSPVR